LVQRSTFTRLLAWVSIILSFDGLLIEPYAMRYFGPGLQLGDDLRWQCQLIVAGLLALAVAIMKGSWHWVLFSLLVGALGVLWTFAILLNDR